MSPWMSVNSRDIRRDIHEDIREDIHEDIREDVRRNMRDDIRVDVRRNVCGFCLWLVSPANLASDESPNRPFAGGWVDPRVVLHDLAVFDGMCAQLCAAPGREERVERIVVVVDELLAVDSSDVPGSNGSTASSSYMKTSIAGVDSMPPGPYSLCRGNPKALEVDGWRAPPLLPLDILYHILAIHRQDWPDDIATLTACTLVCKEWRDVARGYAFSTITVGSGADGRRFDDFFNFIKHSPHSACYIKELILKYKPKPTLRLVPPYKKLALAFPYPRRIPFNNPVGHPVFYESPPLGSVDLARLDLSAFLAAAPNTEHRGFVFKFSPSSGGTPQSSIPLSRFQSSYPSSTRQSSGSYPSSILSSSYLSSTRPSLAYPSKIPH
ncbi:hypothetical protein C8Q76DRAFT_795227 [Earliella scabrosa]|nr:hypothetical protein C8Q76DRAFT_795227 [Earliella scabrosa]